MGKSKAKFEDEFVEQIKAAGIEWCSKMYERGHWYWCFMLKDGQQRFWKDLSEENQKKLGVYSEH